LHPLDTLIRAFATGGYANLSNAHQWMLGFVKESPQSARYEALARRIAGGMPGSMGCAIFAIAATDA